MKMRMPDFAEKEYAKYIDKFGEDQTELLRNRLTELEKQGLTIEPRQLNNNTLFEGISYDFRYKLKKRPHLIERYTDHKVKRINEKKSILVRYRKHEFWMKEVKRLDGTISRIIDTNCPEANAYYKKLQRLEDMKLRYKAMSERHALISNIKADQQCIDYIKAEYQPEKKQLQAYINKLQKKIAKYD